VICWWGKYGSAWLGALVLGSCIVCVWRYGASGLSTYKHNILQLFETFRRVLKPETLFIWTTALPVSQSVHGGVILDTIRFLSDVLRYDILLANDFSSRAAADHGFDVLDLHYGMRRHIDLRLPDGIHWNSEAHRRITALLLRHVCLAWKVVLPLKVSVSFGRLCAGRNSNGKPRNPLLETPTTDDVDATPRNSNSRSSRADSKQSRVPPLMSIGDSLLPTPTSEQRNSNGKPRNPLLETPTTDDVDATPRNSSSRSSCADSKRSRVPPLMSIGDSLLPTPTGERLQEVACRIWRWLLRKEMADCCFVHF